jgi:hypothetical protein
MSSPLDESSPVPNHSAVRLSLYLTILLSGFCMYLPALYVRLFSVTYTVKKVSDIPLSGYSLHFTLYCQSFPCTCPLCCHVSLHLPTPLACCPCTYAAPLRLSLNLRTPLAYCPCAYAPALRLSLNLPTPLAYCPCAYAAPLRLSLNLPTPLAYCPCAYAPALRLSLYLPILLSGFPAPTHSAVEFPCAYALLCQVFLYIPTLLLGCPCINPALICCPCTYPLCCQISLLPTQYHSAVRFSLPTLLSDFPYPLCCQIFPTHLLSGFPAIIHGAVRFSLYLLTLRSSFSKYLPALLLYCPCTYPFCCRVVICTFTPLSGFHSAGRILPTIQALL